MYITLKAAHGAEVSVEIDDENMTPDGVDTHLRQITEVYANMLAIDIACGVVAQEIVADLPEIETVLGPEEDS